MVNKQLTAKPYTLVFLNQNLKRARQNIPDVVQIPH